MSIATATTNPPALPEGNAEMSMNRTGGLRTQLQDGAGNDVSTAHPLPVNATAGASITSATALSSGVAATAGRSIQITVSVSGTVTLTLSDTSTVIVTPQVGDNIYPYAVTTATTGTATVTRMYNLS